MSRNENFEFESIQDPDTIKTFMESLLQGFEKNRIRLASNGEEIVLFPSNMLKFAVKAKRKGNSSKLSLKISWKELKSVNVEAAESIEISTDL